MMYYSKTSSGKKCILMEYYSYQMVLPRDKQLKKFDFICYKIHKKVKSTTDSKGSLKTMDIYLSVTEQLLKVSAFGFKQVKTSLILCNI